MPAMLHLRKCMMFLVNVPVLSLFAENENKKKKKKTTIKQKNDRHT